MLSSFFGPELPEFVKWCDINNLDLSVSKTKEVIIDLRQNAEHKVGVIHGKDVRIVKSYKYLGFGFDCKLRFDINTESIVKPGQQKFCLS